MTNDCFIESSTNLNEDLWNQIRECPYCQSKNLRLLQTGPVYKHWMIACDDCNLEGPVADRDSKALDKWNSLMSDLYT